ncbi:MAG TPA: hypothetical protein VNF47_23115 [Streptosporangiaceae bacterium]|nr:hypothetical protein [Streptosporangiaceae bacterium]
MCLATTSTTAAARKAPAGIERQDIRQRAGEILSQLTEGNTT